MQEAGFHPLEVIRAATSQGADLVGLADEIGSVEVGKCADLLVHDHNPLTDFKLLYGTGAMRLNDDDAAGRMASRAALHDQGRRGLRHRRNCSPTCAQWWNVAMPKHPKHGPCAPDGS